MRDSDLKGFILRVQPSGQLTYYCCYRLRDGRCNRVKIGRHGHVTPIQARDHAKRILADVVKGIDPAAAKKAPKVDDFLVYIEDKYRPWAEANRKTGHATVARLKACFPELLNRKLSDITPWVVEKWRFTRLKDGIKPATANRDLSALKAALSKAVDWGLVEVHPLVRVKPSKVDTAQKVRFLDSQEEHRLRRMLDSRQEHIRRRRDSANKWRRCRGYQEFSVLREVCFVDWLKPMVLLSMNTGLRRGELFCLKWEDVDLTRRLLTVSGHIAKSGKTRHIPLNTDAWEVLSGWKEQHKSNDELIFPSKDGKPFNNIKKAWARLLHDAHIRNFRWHDLRHHFASKLVMAGVDINTVRELLGHGDIKMTLRYAHLAPEHKAAAVERLVSSRS